MSVPLAVGVVLALASLAYVLHPVLRIGGRDTAEPSPRRAQRRVSDEEIEAAVRAYRSSVGVAAACDVCGPRPETDALFCSNCGRPVQRPTVIRP